MPAQPAVTRPARPLARHASLGRAAAAVALYEGLTQVAERGQKLWRDRFAYTVTVTERDPIYTDVHDWLRSILPTDRHRSLVVHSTSPHDHQASPVDDPGQPERRIPLRIMFNDQRPRRVQVDGHQLTVVVESAESKTTRERETTPDRITFTARTHAGQQAVVTHLRRLHAQRRHDRSPVLRMVNQWGSWRARSDLPPRSLTSVALSTDQRDRIVTDLRGFLDAEERYNCLAIPWHRGYMFHGPPGTGKTSLVKALASEFRLDLWYVSLSDLTAEASLMGLLSEVGPRSMLLLEDIDTVAITHDRDTQQGKISMSSLLNALDGVATPHGLITVMTTNHFDKLDPALTRAGRMDVVEELTHATPAVVTALFAHYFDTRLTIDEDAWPSVTTAAVSEVLKRHLDNPNRAAAALDELFAARRRSEAAHHAGDGVR